MRDYGSIERTISKINNVTLYRDGFWLSWGLDPVRDVVRVALSCYECLRNLTDYVSKLEIDANALEDAAHPELVFEGCVNNWLEHLPEHHCRGAVTVTGDQRSETPRMKQAKAQKLVDEALSLAQAPQLEPRLDIEVVDKALTEIQDDIVRAAVGDKPRGLSPALVACIAKYRADLYAAFQAQQRELRKPALSEHSRNAMSFEWSLQLREKMNASSEAKARERAQVIVDNGDDEYSW